VTMISSDNEWEDFQLEWNIFFKLPGMEGFWRHDLWTSHKQGEYNKLCIKLKEYLDNFQECYRMCVSTMEYIFSLKFTTDSHTELLNCSKQKAVRK
jgi:hypothetical protein